MNKKQEEKQTKKALLKSAVGFESSDVVEEFGLDESGELKLIKRKITKKTIPPNISALKTLAQISLSENSFDALSDEDLEKEKNRLLKMLANLEEGENYQDEKSDE